MQIGAIYICGAQEEFLIYVPLHDIDGCSVGEEEEKERRRLHRFISHLFRYATALYETIKMYMHAHTKRHRHIAITIIYKNENDCSSPGKTFLYAVI
jgi:hypothetical protein